MQKYFGDIDYSSKLNYMCNEIRVNFKKVFDNGEEGLKDTENSKAIRPNQLFAISLTYPVINDSKMVINILNIVESKLVNRYGIKTLVKGEKGYTEKYFGNEKRRDGAYHQGISWPWLLGLYYNGLKFAEKLRV